MSSLNLISLGLIDKEDMSIKALEISKKCDILYLDNYTNYIWPTLKELVKFIGKPIQELNRKELEENSNKIIRKAKIKNVGILISGDCLIATTHSILILDAIKNNIKIQIIHGSSIITAVAETGLFIYNFGKVASIPFENKNVKVPYEILKNNQSLGMHTLFLLDLNPEKKMFLTIKEAIVYLTDNGMDINQLVVGCARLGKKDSIKKSGKAEAIKNIEFGKPPYCLIVPGRMHFIEEEFLKRFK